MSKQKPNKQFTERANTYFDKFNNSLLSGLNITKEEFPRYAKTNKQLVRVINDLEKFQELMKM